MPSRTLFDPHQAIKIKGFGGKMGHLVLTNLLLSERCVVVVLVNILLLHQVFIILCCSTERIPQTIPHMNLT